MLARGKLMVSLCSKDTAADECKYHTIILFFYKFKLYYKALTNVKSKVRYV